jgi:hypothetical protein
MQVNRLQQVIIENRYSRHNISDRIRLDISEDMQAYIARAEDLLVDYLNGSYYTSKQERINHIKYDECLDINNIIMDVFTAIVPHTGAQPIQGAVSLVGSHLGFDSEWDGIKTASEIIAVLAHTDVYDMIYAADSETGSIMVQSNFELEEPTLQYITNTKYLPPMVCRPNDVSFNYSKQYLTKEESLILGKDNHHEKKISLDVINHMNSIELELDLRVLEGREESSKPLDTVDKRKGFKRLQLSSRAVYDEILELGNRFFFTNKYDKRGRLYSQGYHINIQSTEYKKALINFTNKEIIQLN